MNALPEQPATPGGDGEPRGRLASNIVHFARTLRSAGLRVGPGQVLRAIEAVEAAGIAKRDDFYWTLHSVFVNRRDQREIFDQAFHVYWRNPRLLEKMMEMLLPSVGVPPQEDAKQLSRRLQDALQPGKGEAPEDEDEPLAADDTAPGSPPKKHHTGLMLLRLPPSFVSMMDVKRFDMS